MVPPRLVLEAVLTTAPAALWEEAAWVGAVEAALVVLELLLELPPHAASRTVAASVGTSSPSQGRIVGLLSDGVSFSPTLRDLPRAVSFPLNRDPPRAEERRLSLGTL